MMLAELRAADNSCVRAAIAITTGGALDRMAGLA